MGSKRITVNLAIFVLMAFLVSGCGLSGTEGRTAVNTEENAGDEQPEEEISSEVAVPDGETETLLQLIPDEELREIVADATGARWKDTGEALWQKLEQCESLTLKENNIRSLEGLGKALPNLKVLTILYDSWEEAQIEDFSPIAELSHLEALYVRYAVGRDLDFSFLAQMDTVTDLLFYKCDLKDASFLREMPQIERLTLMYTPVGDLAVLENLTKLVELGIYSDSSLKHVEAIGGLTNIQRLKIEDCKISDICFLTDMIRLREIDLSGNSITDISPLARLHQLERLELAKNEVCDLSPLAGLDRLCELDLSRNQISDVTALKKLPYLAAIDIAYNLVQDISPLADKPELLYLSMAHNPCADLCPVLTVPLLYFEYMAGPKTEEQEELVADWMTAYRPDMEEYECSDYLEADLNGDGLPDVAFVVEGEFRESTVDDYDNDHRLFVLLRKRDGSWSEVKQDIHLSDTVQGIISGDPYRGMWMGNGYLAVKENSGWSRQGTLTVIYRYQRGRLEPVRTIVAERYGEETGYSIMEYNREEPGDQWERYAIVMDGARMVRLDLANHEHRATHKALPLMELPNIPYDIHDDGQPTQMDGVVALEVFHQTRINDWEREELPYVSWQKKSYERIKGVALPDYYYVCGEQYFYYYDLEHEDDEYYHVIRSVWDYSVWSGERYQDFRVNDSTGKIEEKK